MVKVRNLPGRSIEAGMFCSSTPDSGSSVACSTTPWRSTTNDVVRQVIIPLHGQRKKMLQPKRRVAADVIAATTATDITDMMRRRTKLRIRVMKKRQRTLHFICAHPP